MIQTGETVPAGTARGPRPLLPRPGLVLGLAGGLLLAWAVVLAAGSHRFGYDTTVLEMPVFALTGWLVGGGVVFFALFIWMRFADRHGALAISRRGLVLVFAVGLAMRLAMLGSEPVLEDDYQRYLWDGGVTAHGINPYETAPERALDLANAPLSVLPRPSGDDRLAELARAAGPLVERINHPDLRTIYPPVAQGLFALAHLISPWNLDAWRMICLLGEVASFGLILLLLSAMGRSGLWSLVYWWNPLVVKEAVNSAHLEAALLPMVLAALVLALRARPVLATGLVGLAIGTKIWPALLLPLIWRPLLGEPRRLMAALGLLAVMLGLLAIPVLAGGLDQSSGFLAYAQNWKTNSAMFPMLENAMAGVLGLTGAEIPAPGLAVRGLIALLLGGLALVVAVKPWTGAAQLLPRAMLVLGALVLLSPAQFPWYMLWVLPLLPMLPVVGFAALAVLMPLYYCAFYFLARNEFATYQTFVIWLIWLPIWALLAGEALLIWARARRN